MSIKEKDAIATLCRITVEFLTPHLEETEPASESKILNLIIIGDGELR